jgi:ABC-2 type transport system permease protein
MKINFQSQSPFSFMAKKSAQVGADMPKYLSFFRLRFINGLQYRAAALAGITTQFAWGALEILMFSAFYQSDANAFPMKFQALSSYIWIQQAFLALYMTWLMENEIFDSIKNGNIAYELCRPIHIYTMWFTRSLSYRLSRAVLRCMPILIVAVVLPKPYGLSLPEDGFAVFWFMVTMVLALLNVVAFCMLIYISTFYTVSPLGIRIVATSLVEFLSGAVIPLPFLPREVRILFELLPFGSMQNVPLRIYSGDIGGKQIYIAAGLQLFWLVFMVFIGKTICNKALKKVVVQGG